MLNAVLLGAWLCVLLTIVFCNFRHHAEAAWWQLLAFSRSDVCTSFAVIDSAHGCNTRQSARCHLSVTCLCYLTEVPLSMLLSGGGQGDLYVFVRVKEHADLRREGLTIHSDASVSFVDAILGGLACVVHFLPACACTVPFQVKCLSTGLS